MNISRERLEQLADENTMCKVSWDERIEMARALLAVMEAEPGIIAENLKHLDWSSVSDHHRAVIAAAVEMLSRQPATPPAPSVPPGWQLVPVEPTGEMCDIGHIGIDVLTGVTEDDEYYSTNGEDAAKIYRAMLAAAPVPGSE